MAIIINKSRIVKGVDNWTYSSVEDTKIAISSYSENSVHLIEYRGRTNLSVPPVAALLTQSFVVPAHHTPPYDWSPTQQEVNAYVNSLEAKISRERWRTHQYRVKAHGDAAPSSLWPLKSDSAFWGIMLVAAACICFLISLVSE
jgi:hypothetical protein